MLAIMVVVEEFLERMSFEAFVAVVAGHEGLQPLEHGVLWVLVQQGLVSSNVEAGVHPAVRKEELICLAAHV